MNHLDLETITHVVTIVGGAIGLILAILQIADTWLDLRDRLKKKAGGKKSDKSFGH